MEFAQWWLPDLDCLKSSIKAALSIFEYTAVAFNFKA
jgi:hypothetical protein